MGVGERIAAMRIFAADWSGKLKRAEEFLWLVESRNGSLVDLRSGLGRAELVERLVGLASEDPRMVVGLDFAFSFPRWWCDEPIVWADHLRADAVYALTRFNNGTRSLPTAGDRDRMRARGRQGHVIPGLEPTPAPRHRGPTGARRHA